MIIMKLDKNQVLSNQEERIMMLKSKHLISANEVIRLRNKPYDDALRVVNQTILFSINSSEWKFTSNSFREKIDLSFPYFIDKLKEAGYSVKFIDSNLGKILILSITKIIQRLTHFSGKLENRIFC